MQKNEAVLLKIENQHLIVKWSQIKKGLRLSNPLSADRTGPPNFL
jgi:hypothetical protein